MARVKTIEEINYDSNRSNYERMAARAINITRKNNGHVSPGMAIARMAIECGIDKDEATEYVNGVISDANDIEFCRQENKGK